MDDSIAVQILAALAHGHRLAVFRLLVAEGPSGMAAGDIARAAGVSATSASFHLKELQRAGLIRASRQGRFIRYSVEVEAMRGLLTYLTEDCCQGRPDLCGGDIAKLAASATRKSCRATECL